MISETAYKLLKDRKKRALLIHSESVKQYPTFYHFLNANEEISDELINNQLSDEDKLLVEHMLPNIIHMCEDEWQGEEEPYDILDGDSRISCQLCGTDNKKIYYIFNTLNGKKMNVGSTCITEFTSLEKLGIKKTQSQLEKNAKRNLNLRKLNELYPGIQDIVQGWNEELKRYDVLIPKFLETEFLQIGERFKKTYNDYLDGKTKSFQPKDFEPLMSERSAAVKKMQDYAEQNKSKKFVVTRAIANWLERKEDKQTLELLKQTGFVSEKTIGKIAEEKFILSLIPEINTKLKGIGASIVGTDEEQRSYIIKPLPEKELLLTCRSDKFLDTFGWTFFTEKGGAALILFNLLKVCSIANINSKRIVLEELNKKLSREKLRLKFENSKDQYFRYNELDVVDRRNNNVVVLELNAFVDKFKHLGFVNKDIKEVVGYIDGLPNRRYTERELRESRSGRKD